MLPTGINLGGGQVLTLNGSPGSQIIVNDTGGGGLVATALLGTVLVAHGPACWPRSMPR
jgi:hypothetical protein